MRVFFAVGLIVILSFIAGVVIEDSRPNVTVGIMPPTAVAIKPPLKPKPIGRSYSAKESIKRREKASKAAAKRSEDDWVKIIAGRMPQAKMEVRTPDGSYIDILTPTHAFEVDWGYKWHQGVGQALFYGAASHSRPGLILLLKPSEQRYYLRALVVCSKYGIVLQIVDVPE